MNFQSHTVNIVQPIQIDPNSTLIHFKCLYKNVKDLFLHLCVCVYIYIYTKCLFIKIIIKIKYIYVYSAYRESVYTLSMLEPAYDWAYVRTYMYVR